MIEWKKFHIPSTWAGTTTEHRCYYQDIVFYKSHYTLFDVASGMEFGYVVYDDNNRFINHFEKIEDMILFCEREIKLKILNGDILGTEN